MVGDQPNKALVLDLSDNSSYIPDLDGQFNDVSYLQKLRFFWAFETKVTRTVSASKEAKPPACVAGICADISLQKLPTGKFSRTGPETVMVPKESATKGLCNSNPALTIQIDEDHSNMVKFSTGDHRIDILAIKLSEIFGIEHKSLPDELSPSFTIRTRL
ncbi:unnamed protein product [Clonostachys rhizophaga]|uniref:Uncharacterized protein n=1 Tax=Clonostachys rhizophaga TaxID=160324 RepID=A0A9N9VLX7_9HYPO|nr:unnamed protein product [Clonostachys rhizophaga]